MSCRLVPFEPFHVKGLPSTSADGYDLFEGFTDGNWAALAAQDTWSLFAADWALIAFGGLICHYPGRTETWLYVSPLARRHMRPLLRACLSKVQGCAGRVEMTVRRGFSPGYRFAGLLGFCREGVARRYGPHGEDHVRFVRFN